MKPSPWFFRASAPVFCTAALWLGVGCADPSGEFDAFSGRVDQLSDDGGVTPDAPEEAADGQTGDEPAVCELPATGDVGAYYYVALSAVIGPTKPIMFRGTLTWDGANLSMVFQPLSATDHQTDAGTPVSGGPFPVAADGSFEADMGTLAIAGAANPISGSDIVTTGTLHAGPGQFCKPLDFMCGAVTGIVSEPVYLNGFSLEKSTFTMQRMADATSFPAGKIPINCERKEAAF